MKKLLLAAMGMTALSAASVQAAETQTSELKGGFGFVGELDLEFGGDTVDTVIYTDNSTQNVKAGQGLGFAIGAHYRPEGWVVDFSGTIGYKYVSTKASNADIRISRTVLELLAIYDPNETWWAAAGVVRHSGVEFDTDGFGANQDLGSATGLTLQAGWKWIGLTYVNMEYQETNRWRRKYDASSIGLTLRWRS